MSKKPVAPLELSADGKIQAVFTDIVDMIHRRARKEGLVPGWYLSNLLIALLDAAPLYIPHHIWDESFRKVDKARRRALRAGSQVMVKDYLTDRTLYHKRHEAQRKDAA